LYKQSQEIATSDARRFVTLYQEVVTLQTEAMQKRMDHRRQLPTPCQGRLPMELWDIVFESLTLADVNRLLRSCQAMYYEVSANHMFWETMFAKAFPKVYKSISTKHPNIAWIDAFHSQRSMGSPAREGYSDCLDDDKKCNPAGFCPMLIYVRPDSPVFISLLWNSVLERYDSFAFQVISRPVGRLFTTAFQTLIDTTLAVFPLVQTGSLRGLCAGPVGSHTVGRCRARTAQSCFRPSDIPHAAGPGGSRSPLEGM